MSLESAAISGEGNTSPNSTAPLEHGAGAEIVATAPGGFQVIRRNGKVTTFDGNKIKVALTKAFLAVEGSNAAASTRIHSRVDELTDSSPGLHALRKECINFWIDVSDRLIFHDAFVAHVGCFGH